MRALLYAALGLADAGTPLTASSLRRTLDAMGAPCPEAEIALLESLVGILAGGALKPQASAPPALGAGAAKTSSGDTAAATPTPRTALERSRVLHPTEPDDPEILYVYAVVPATPAWSGGSGIDGHEVFAVVLNDVAALVHRVPPGQSLPTPDAPVDMVQVAAQAAAHEAVVTQAMAQAGTALPLRLNTMVHAGSHADATSAMRNWLYERQDHLRDRLDALREMAEYAVVVRLLMAESDAAASAQDPEIERMTREMAGKSPNLQRLYRHKLERAIQDRLTIRMRNEADAVRAALAPLCAAIREEPLRRLAQGDDDVLLRLALLLDEGSAAKVGEALEALALRPELSIRFTGPWPPYSFVDVQTRDGA